MPKAAGSTTTRATATQPTLGSKVEQSADDWFTPLEDQVEDTNTLLYGKEGSGKSTSIGRMTCIRPEGRVLVINAEGGLKVKALQKRGVDTSRITVWPPRNKPITHEGLIHVYDKVRGDLEADPQSWIGVGMDSATEVYQALLAHVTAKRVAPLQMAGRPVDPWFTDRDDYNPMMKQFRDVLRKFRDLPCHFVVTALERRDVDQDTGKTVYGPAVSPALQTDLLGYMDWVMMMKSADEDGPFRALTRANSRYRAKDRFDVLPRVMAEPMMDRAIAYLSGDLTEDEDPFQTDLPSSAQTAENKPAASNKDDDEESEEGDTNQDD